jgi:Uncharacterized conserved protein
LVRDNIPNILESKGINHGFKIIEEKEKISFLKKKLDEEVKEVKIELKNNNKTKIIEELADVLEVIDALSNCFGFELSDIINIKKQKAIEKGGFNKGIVLLFTEEKE